MCHYTNVPDTAGRKAKGGGQSVDVIFVGFTSYLQITPTTGFTTGTRDMKYNQRTVQELEI